MNKKNYSSADFEKAEKNLEAQQLAKEISETPEWKDFIQRLKKGLKEIKAETLKLSSLYGDKRRTEIADEETH